MTTNEEIAKIVANFELLFGAENVPSGLHVLIGSGRRITNRKTMPSHVTCSAIVLNPGNEVLMVHHIVLRRWLFPGGHVEDDDQGLLSAACREISEEAGIDRHKLIFPDWMPRDTPIDIDSHPIPDNAKKGEGHHTHFDFRFVFLVPEAQIEHQADEVDAAEWRPLSDAPAKIAGRIRMLSTKARKHA